jgi:high-affinity iron transporter
MLASALIVFREVLEAALIIGIVLGATRGIQGRNSFVAWGIASGTGAAVIVAALMGKIAGAVSGTGQALFEAAVLLTAVAMLGWHNVWMSRHGKKLSAELKTLGRAVGSGVKPMTAVYFAVALAVMREGSEIVLFLYGVSASGAGAACLGLGACLGLAAGVAAGVAIYWGLMSLPVRFFFRATAGMILFLAAGMASQAAAFLNQADLLPSIKDSLWDTSWLLSAQSLGGTILKTLVGYTPSPSGLQLLFYAGTFILIASLMKFAQE